MSFTQSNHLSTDAYNSIPVSYNINSITDGYNGVFYKQSNSLPFDNNYECVTNKQVCFNSSPDSYNSKHFNYSTITENNYIQPDGFKNALLRTLKSLQTIFEKIKLGKTLSKYDRHTFNSILQFRNTKIKTFMAANKYKSVNTEAELKKLINLLCLITNIYQIIKIILNMENQEFKRQNEQRQTELYNFLAIASQSLNSLLKSVESGKILSKYDNSILESISEILYMKIKRFNDNNQKFESIYTESERIQFRNLLNLINTIYEINYKILQNQELKRKVFFKNLAEESNIITTNNNFNIDESHSKSIFIQPTTTKKNSSKTS